MVHKFVLGFAKSSTKVMYGTQIVENDTAAPMLIETEIMTIVHL